MLQSRLAAQQIEGARFSTPGALVAWMGAMQAQDYGASKWAIGLRLSAPVTDADVEAAEARGEILRTHAMRGTWQWVSPADVRWLVRLFAPNVRASAGARHRALGLDAATIRRFETKLARALRGTSLTRAEITDITGERGVRLMHLLGSAEYSEAICTAGRRGKQPTWALLDDRAPAAPPRSRAEALADLATRYVASRGPATADDFLWWTGLPAAEARAAFAEVPRTSAEVPRTSAEVPRTSAEVPRTSAEVPRTSAEVPRTLHLLPAFDEWLIAYRDRSATLEAEHVRRVNDGGGIFAPLVVVKGRVVGTWKRVGRRIEPRWFGAPAPKRAFEAAVARYVEFLGA
jgi:hypothetical protein